MHALGFVLLSVNLQDKLETEKTWECGSLEMLKEYINKLEGIK